MKTKLFFNLQRHNAALRPFYHCALINLIRSVITIWTVIPEARGQAKLVGKLAHVLHY